MGSDGGGAVASVGGAVRGSGSGHAQGGRAGPMISEGTIPKLKVAGSWPGASSTSLVFTMVLPLSRS